LARGSLLSARKKVGSKQLAVGSQKQKLNAARRLFFTANCLLPTEFLCLQPPKHFRLSARSRCMKRVKRSLIVSRLRFQPVLIWIDSYAPSSKNWDE
jgi:hypothetical protein